MAVVGALILVACVALASDQQLDALLRIEALRALADSDAEEPHPLLTPVLLLPLTRGLGRASLPRAARAAIARIQLRLSDVEAGCISLAEGADRFC
jgi:hypothetical protein